MSTHAEADGPSYSLRAECWGHEEDVRGLGVVEHGFLTASRDKTVKLWAEHDAHAFDNTLTLIGHEDYVGTVACIPPNTAAAYPEGAIVSGSRDKSVIVWDTRTGQKLKQLRGHKWQVTSVAILLDGSIASASLDGTIRVWDSEGSSQVLEGHEGPVQCLLVLPDGGLLSGSNDKTIRLWHPPSCAKTLTGHTDTVRICKQMGELHKPDTCWSSYIHAVSRGLALVPGLGFVSASHDTTLQLWTAGGENIATLAGHTALVYSAAATSNGTIASASEDNTARLWRADGTCLQVLEHPACVWDVVFLPNGDLVTGCADFAARVWTATADRVASGEAIQKFQQALEARKVAAAGSNSAEAGGLPEGLKMEDPMALLTAGTKDGQTKIIREGGAGIAYNWSAARGEWEKLGEVVGGPAQDTVAVGGKQLWGQTWDYVFDVDIADGAPVKRLPVNRGEDPYDAADRFMEVEGLPVSYREQIVSFIVQNSHGGVQMPDVPMANVDPFTGGGAYVPGGAGSSMGSAPDSSAQSTVTGGGMDPFTGGSSSAAAPTSSHMPVTAYATFTNAPNTEAIARKVRETSGQMAATPDLAFSEEEGAAGGVLDQLLSRAGSRQGGAAPVEQLALLAKMLRWPAAVLFPALDVTRLLALDAGFALALAESAGNVSGAASGGIGGAFATAMTEPQSAANQQTALRLACNAFQHDRLRAWIAPQIGSLLDGFSPALQSAAKAVRLGMASFLLNCAVLTKESDVKMQLLSGLTELLGSIPDSEPEAQYRALVAVGTLVHQDSELLSAATGLAVPDQVRAKQAAGGKVAEAAQELLRKF